MDIHGLQKVTLIDFPKQVACTVFLDRCNFRCGFCFNPKLALGKETNFNMQGREFFEFLEKRKNLLDGVCITGGEPTMHPELAEFCGKIKGMGFLVKLDTNGSNPGMLKTLINKKLVDYIAMDIKAPLEKYDEIVGAKVNKEAIRESIALIMNSGIDYEFRSTLLPKFHSAQDMEKMASMVEGADLYCLQQFNPNAEMIDNELKKERKFIKEELEALKKIAERYVKKVELRGI
ncbi:MAG: anaerobic ribonucleoside-triphosphate reductase activating protein [Candidatus Diapherotrites archaeon]|uniref:Anaerobic ribonucleoside-triphosphate reductase activating protein n=1 Tax=Candidatus Iainarchaeum sp. TaxID=3101447 RepID=A0A8T4KQI6_9ARCH|nr:anaerobic ribonucleoside-triphosphate reductase activating protein [Candidatus Diapherotrites archaeon]